MRNKRRFLRLLNVAFLLGAGVLGLGLSSGAFRQEAQGTLHLQESLRKMRQETLPMSGALTAVPVRRD